MILVEAEEMEVEVGCVSTGFSNKNDVEVELTASVRVEGLGGRLLGAIVTSQEDELVTADGFGTAARRALTTATTKALQDLVRQIAEKVANSRRVRGLES